MEDWDQLTQEFAHSLPQSYRERYKPSVVAAHARTAQERGENPVNTGQFVTEAEGISGLCIAARQQPELLAAITETLVIAGFDIVDAETYTRTNARGQVEGIDLFWMRRSSPERRGQLVSPREVEQITQRLRAQLAGELTDAPPPSTHLEGSLPTSRQDTRVRFIEDQSGALCHLEVETGDRSGLLLALSRALFSQRVQIVQSEVRTRGDRVFDRFSLVEFDGQPISEGRRLEIQVAVLSAIELQL